MLRVYSLLLIICAGLALNAPEAAAQFDHDAVPTAASTLHGARLPAGAVRVRDDRVPADIHDALARLVNLGEGKFRQGASEVLLWTGGGYRRANAGRLVKQLVDNLQAGGWTYAVGEQNAEFTAFNLLNSAERRLLIGFWTANETSLVVALTEMLPANAANVNSSNAIRTPARHDSAPSATPTSANVLRVGARTDHINVMGDEMPAIPAFPGLPKKTGYVRGHVKDTNGRPIVGAKLGFKTARMYDAYLAASAETDASGYYEIKIPLGGGRFDYAGLTVAYGAGRAALGLHPADGGLSESYPAATGAVENFVLLPYGVANAEDVGNAPRYRSNYYGGSLLLRYFIGEFDGMLAPGSEIEIALTPEGNLIDGSRGRSFVIRKTVEDSTLGEFHVNNVPVGRYRIEVRQNGRPLKLTQKAPTGSVFGIEPKEVAGGATLVFNPLSSDAKTAAASRGNWTDLEIIVGRP